MLKKLFHMGSIASQDDRHFPRLILNLCEKIVNGLFALGLAFCKLISLINEQNAATTVEDVVDSLLAS